MRNLYFSVALAFAAALFTLPASAQSPGSAESVGATLATPAPDALARGGSSLQPFFNLTGRISLSTDGVGISSSSGSIGINVPQGGSVVKAFLFTANIPGSLLSNGSVSLNGIPISYDVIAQGQLFSAVYVGRADVTNIVANALGAGPPAGITSIPYSEMFSSTTDGSVLAVVFNAPNNPVSTVSLLFGVQSPAGDNFSVALASPFDDDETDITLRLGISFGFQSGTDNQSSLIDVNGARLTSSAGGYDDGQAANGALITVGGIGDDPGNPPDPNQTDNGDDRYDDELYTLDPLIAPGSTAINVFSQNPSNDDAVFFAGFQFFGATAIVGEGILLTPTQTDTAVNTPVTLRASVQDDDGDPVSGRTVDFEVVSGPNAGLTGSSVTDAIGNATFTLQSAIEGTDIVQATFVDSNGDPKTSNQARVTYGNSTPADLTVEYVSSTRNPVRNSFLRFRSRVTNNTGGNVAGRLFLDCLNPTGTRLYRTRIANGTLRPFQSVVLRDRTRIPANAPAGTYLCTITAENPAGTIVYDLDDFQFTLPPLPPLTTTDPAPEASAKLASGETLVAPNPFRDEARFSFSLAEDADVRLAVYDVRGREVAVIVNGFLTSGEHTATLDARTLPSGTYVWRLASGETVQTGRVTLVR